MNETEFNNVRNSLREQLKESEGLRLKMYKDTKGYNTIGWGHNLDAKGISKATADFILEEDINDAYHDLMSAFPWVIGRDPRVLRVLWDMCYNMGIGSENSKRGLRGFKTTMRLIEEAQYSKASRTMLQSQYAKDVGHRAIALSNILRSVPDGIPDLRPKTDGV